MKKIVALFLTCAMALSLTASAAGTWLFSRNQFQITKAPATKEGYTALTFPLVYKGTLKWNGWYIDPTEAVCVDTVKITPALYMTICQPCIDCFPCEQIEFAAGVQTITPAPAEEPGKITAWNLYVVIPYKVGKVSFTAIRKINLGNYDGEDAAAIFFTGAKNGLAMVQAYPTNVQFILTGKKSDYTFNYTDADLDGNQEWTINDTKYNKNKGYIKSVTAFSGAFNVAYPYDGTYGYHVNGVVDLKRDATLTKMAAKAVFGIGYTTTKNWEDCGEDAAYCEQYFIADDNDLFDEYLTAKYIKTIDGDIVMTVLEEIFDEAYGLVIGQ